MTTQRGTNKKTEFLGINYVADVINKADCVFNKIDGSNDYGLDGYIEFFEKSRATGLCVGCQIKAGESYQDGNRSQIKIKTDKHHIEYWGNHILPISAIVLITSEDQAYWVDITAYIKENPSILTKGPYVITFKKVNPFTVERFKEFNDHFSNYKELYSKDWNFGKALKCLVHTKVFEERVFAIKSLFYFHRFQEESWYYLISQFILERDSKIERLLIFILSHLISRNDQFWHKDNFIPDAVIEFGRQEIKRLFGVNELYKLLKHIDEAGITRGSLGQSIAPIIDFVPDKIESLKKIILNSDTPEDIRAWAGIILINDFQYYDIDRAIKFANSMIINFPKSENLEWFEQIKATLIEDGFVNFIG